MRLSVERVEVSLSTGSVEAARMREGTLGVLGRRATIGRFRDRPATQPIRNIPTGHRP